MRSGGRCMYIWLVRNVMVRNVMVIMSSVSTLISI